MFDKGDGIKETFKVINNGTYDASNKLALPLSPLLSDILSNQANNFAYYRFIRLKFRIRKNQSGDGTPVPTDGACCFYSGVPDATPGTLSTISSVSDSVYWARIQTAPSEWCSVPPTTLLGKQPWYKAVAGTPEAVEELQGYLLFVGSGTVSGTVTYEIRGQVEFKDQVDSTATPPLSEKERWDVVSVIGKKFLELARVRRETLVARQRQHALAVLASTSTAQPNP